MTRRPFRPAARATGREVRVVAAVLVAGSEKAAAHRLGPLDGEAPPGECQIQGGGNDDGQLVWILAERLPDADRYCQPFAEVGLRIEESSRGTGRR